MSINDILQLSKFRLTTSVVFSAIAYYFIAGGYLVSLELLYLAIGGFMVVASSNGFNQIIEKDLDGLMERTSNRPLPKQRMPITQAYYFSLIMGSLGVLSFIYDQSLLWLFWLAIVVAICFGIYSFKT